MKLSVNKVVPAMKPPQANVLSNLLNLQAARSARVPSRGVLAKSTPTTGVHHQVLNKELQHRVDRLTCLANEYVKYWSLAAKEGASPEVMDALCSIMDPTIKVSSSRLTGAVTAEGMHGVRDMMTLAHASTSCLQPTGVVNFTAVNDMDDTVFALLECDSIEKTGKTPHRAYALVKLDILLDDTALRVTGVTERSQMEPHEAFLLSLHKGAVVEETLGEVGGKHFPSENIKRLEDTAFDDTTAKHSINAWAEARCTGKDETTLLADALDTEKFRLWDAYGVLPVVCGIGESSSTSPSDCLMGAEEVKNLISETKSKFYTDVTLIDSAICGTHNVGFSHWKTCVRPLQAKGEVEAGEAFVMEGDEVMVEALEMYTFNPQGRIMDCWMLRDPMPNEKEVLMGVLANHQKKQA